MDILNRYRENHDSSSSEDDSENSDNECAVWKRATNKKTYKDEHLENDEMKEESHISPNNDEGEIKEAHQSSEQPKPGQKRKRNTIWCDVLQDQLISEDLEDCLLKNKPRHYGSRGKESYDYTQAYADERRDSESEMSGCSLSGDSSVDSKFKSKKRQPFPAHRKNFRKFVKLDSAELDASRKINKVLNEKKYYLIQRIVKFVGIEKAMQYLEKTKEIEDNGGMMIKNQSRRRTPGGVYLQVLKEDKDVKQEIRDKIFEGEMSGHEMKKYFNEKRRKRKKKKKNFKQSSKDSPINMAEADIEPMEPDETVSMNAEVMVGEKHEVSNSEINLPSVPVIDNKPSENVSDLEEGEIED